MRRRKDPVLGDDDAAAKVLHLVAPLLVLKGNDPRELALTGNNAPDNGAALQTILSTGAIQFVHRRNAGAVI